MKPAIHVKKTQIGKLNKRSTTREGDPQLQTVEDPLSQFTIFLVVLCVVVCAQVPRPRFLRVLRTCEGVYRNSRGN
jgi:hypothetical protein